MAAEPSVTSMSVLQAMEKPKQRTQAQREARAEWKERLAAYYSINAPHKTEQDVELCLEHFEPPDGEGFAEMYVQVQKRFGPEPNGDQMRAARERIRWLYKLRSYYALVDSTKTQHDIEVILGRFAMEGRSYEELWSRVQAKYGVYVDQPHPALVAAARRDENIPRRVSPTHQPLPGARRRPEGDLAPGPKQIARALPLREGALVTRHMVAVVITGLLTKVYRAAGPVSKANFHRAACMEMADNMNVHDVEAFRVNRLSDHVDGSVIEFEFEMPRGWTTEATGRELIRKVTNGETTIATLRQSYADDLGGNPTRVFIADAAVVEYHTSPGLRYNPTLSAKKPSLNATEGDLVEEVAVGAPYPRGVVPDGVVNPPQHAPQLYHTPIGVRRPTSPTARTLPTRDGNTSIVKEDRDTVTPTKRIRPGAAAAGGGGKRDVGAISRLIAEPTEVSTSPIQDQHFDSNGRRIPSWDVIPRPTAPDILTGGPLTPRAHQKHTASAISSQQHPTQVAASSKAITPSSFMQLYQLGEWGSNSDGEPTPSTRAQLAHAQRGGEL